MPIKVPRHRLVEAHPADGPAAALAPVPALAIRPCAAIVCLMIGGIAFGIAVGLAAAGQTGAKAIAGVLLVAALVQASLVFDRQSERARWRRREAELLELAASDPLTGLDNRFAFEEMLTRLAGQGEPVLVAFADLDAFKAVNDAHGHLAGDAVLVDVAARLRDHAPSACSIARFGGDEFALVFPVAAGAERAKAELAAARAAIARPYEYAGALLTVETSLGFAASAGGGQAPAAALLRQADAMLYADKAARRALARAAPPSAVMHLASVA